MKKTKTKIGFRNLLVLDLLLLMAVFFIFKPFDVASSDRAFAEELNGTGETAEEKQFPYNKTFIISAYYSPLPCQNRYSTGSYEREIALNGRGVRGADGTGVYAGMVAAPKSYPFGTKLDIPGVGIVAVHDRGGAIVSSDTGRVSYDRLDIWMGYGDKGLQRALNWGKRTVDVAVYGINDNIAEQVSLGDYSPDEGIQNDCSGVVAPEAEPATVEQVVNPPAPVVPTVTTAPAATKAVAEPVETVKTIGFLVNDLKPGDKGEEVKALQEELRKLNLFRTESSGFYGDTTKHAVFKFQQIQGLIVDENSQFAGVFGPKTRKKMNNLVAASSYNEKRIAAATENYQKTMVANAEADRPRKTLISVQLKYGMRGADVATLQKFLKDQGFFEGNLITQYYGPVTQNAVTEFQKAHKLISTPSDTGAGHVGPATLELINTLS